MNWLVTKVIVPDDDLRDAIIEGLFSLGATSIEERADALLTYFPEDSRSIESIITSLRNSIKVPLEVEHWVQPNEDWSETWKQGLRPRRVGKRFVVAPSWTEPEQGANDLLIIIDPEMAFGTGEHATTRSALRFLETVVQPGDRLLDVGTGSAILAIAAAMLGARHIVAVDYDADAIINARDNIVRNRGGAVIDLQQAMVDAEWLTQFGPAHFDVIAANVLSGVLKPLLASFRAGTRVGGHIILGGILQSEASEMREACKGAGLDVIAEDGEEEWWSVLLRRGQ